MRMRILLPIILLVFVTMACSLPFGGNDTPTEGTTGQSAGPSTLFEDDFASPGSGWDRDTNDSGSTDYQDGEYRIVVNDTNYYKWANPYKTFQDVRVEVDAHAVSDLGGDMGIICRYKDAQNFYFLRITSDGYYGISKLVNGEETLLGSENLMQSGSIKTGTEVNSIRADCVGSQLTLYANGQLLANVSDSDIASGDVGLIAGTFEQGGNDVRFDNFKVYKP